MGPGLARGTATGVLLVGTLLLGSSAGRAQDGPPEPELKQNPMAVLRAFEPAANAPYQLGRGDEISVDVVGRPELSGKHTIGPDGEITLPMVGPVKLADKTREQASTDIQNALANFYSNVSVSVGVDKYTSNHITLLGAVEHPGVMSFDTTPTLLEVISRGGYQPIGTPGKLAAPGETSSAMGSIAVPDECIIFRTDDAGTQTVVTVELRSLVEAGDPLADMRLKRDDRIVVPGQAHFVSVLGQVLNPGNRTLDNKSTLPQLLADAGGIKETAGRNPIISIIHHGNGISPGRTQVIRYKDILADKPIEVTLQSGDIIFVPQSGLTSVGYVFEKLSPLVSLFTTAALITR